MATTPQEFIDLAAELINDEFADFRVSLTLSKDGNYNPSTDVIDEGESYNLQAIPIDIQSAEQIFTNVTNDNVFVVAYKGNTQPSNLDASYSAVLDGVTMTIQEVENDSAGAAWFLRLAK